jgi:hypothetical protein
VSSTGYLATIIKWFVVFVKLTKKKKTMILSIVRIPCCMFSLAKSP